MQQRLPQAISDVSRHPLGLRGKLGQIRDLHWSVSSPLEIAYIGNVQMEGQAVISLANGDGDTASPLASFLPVSARSVSATHKDI